MTKTGSLAWHEFRRGGVGGSDIAAIMGVKIPGSQRDIVDVYLEKTGAKITEKDSVGCLKRGHKLEDDAADEYKELTGHTIRRDERDLIAKSCDYHRAHIDRAIVGHEDGPGVCEIKTARPEVFNKIDREGCPKATILQTIHNIIATGWTWGTIFYLEPLDWQTSLFTFSMNDPNVRDLASAIVDARDKFWLGNVVPRIMPTVSDDSIESRIPSSLTKASLATNVEPRLQGLATDLWKAESARGEIDSAIAAIRQLIQREVEEINEQTDQAEPFQGIEIPLQNLGRSLRYYWREVRGSRRLQQKDLVRYLEDLIARAKFAMTDPEIDLLSFVEQIGALDLDRFYSRGEPSMRPARFWPRLTQEDDS